MSLRARHSRALATRLGQATNTAVSATFDRQLGRYVLCWQVGPTVQTMSLLAAECIESFSALRLDELRYLRTTGAVTHRPNGKWVAKPVAAPELRGPTSAVADDLTERSHRARCA